MRNPVGRPNALVQGAICDTAVGIAQAAAGQCTNRDRGALTGRRMFAGVFAAALFFSLVAASGALARTWKVVFNYDGGPGGFNGSPQYWTVPPRVYRATFYVYGAQGQRGLNGGGAGGLGGEATATLTVHPGEVLQITVGGMPAGYIPFAGYNGGGGGDGYGPSYWGGGGGGASDVRTAPYHLSDRMLIAGGGGGGGGCGSDGNDPYYCPNAPGGAGGGRTAGDAPIMGCGDFGSASASAAGGSQTQGGAGGVCPEEPAGRDGVLGVGGLGASSSTESIAGAPSISGGGGGGGGGLYGGGGGGTTVAGGGGTGGGGGSGYGPSGVVFHNGVRRGSGQVRITYTQNCSAGEACIKPLGAPTDVVATAGHHEARVSFVPPRKGNGIMYFTVSSTRDDHTATGKQSPITVKGLTDGKAYSFTVTATNELGTGPASSRSNSVTPSAVPGAPTGVDAAGGDTVAVVGFTPPGEPDSPIQSYTVTASPGGRTAIGTTSPITVTGLTNGTTYKFKVTATNLIGTGPASASATATPVGPPGAPTDAVAAAGTGQATVSFDAPPTGGEPITKYTVTASPGGLTATGTAAPITVTGLTSGTTYTFTVTATNELGTGPPSSPSNAIVPLGVPGAPTDVVAAAGNDQATVSFTAPPTGGEPITKYTVTASPGGLTATGTASPITIAGLTNGTSYTFTVTATNQIGTGPTSPASNAVTPAGPPGAPTDVTVTKVGANGATVAFTAPTSDGGSPITSYTVTATSSNGGATVTATGTKSPITVNDLSAPRFTYTFTVTATNAAGTGPPSAPSNSITTT